LFFSLYKSPADLSSSRPTFFAKSFIGGDVGKGARCSSKFNINYSAVMPNSDPMRVREAENNENNNIVSTMIDVRGKYSGDRM